MLHTMSSERHACLRIISVHTAPSKYKNVAVSSLRVGTLERHGLFVLFRKLQCSDTDCVLQCVIHRSRQFRNDHLQNENPRSGPQGCTPQNPEASALSCSLQSENLLLQKSWTMPNHTYISWPNTVCLIIFCRITQTTKERSVKIDGRTHVSAAVWAAGQ